MFEVTKITLKPYFISNGIFLNKFNTLANFHVSPVTLMIRFVRVFYADLCNDEKSLILNFVYLVLKLELGFNLFPLLNSHFHTTAPHIIDYNFFKCYALNTIYRLLLNNPSSGFDNIRMFRYFVVVF